MRTMQLVRIEELDGRRHDGYLSEQALRKHGKDLGPNEIILVRPVSMGFLQLVYRRAELDMSKYNRRGNYVARLYHSERVRLVKMVGSTQVRVAITDIMLQDACHEVGIHLAGLVTSEEILKKVVARKAA